MGLVLIFLSLVYVVSGQSLVSADRRLGDFSGDSDSHVANYRSQINPFTISLSNTQYFGKWSL